MSLPTDPADPMTISSILSLAFGYQNKFAELGLFILEKRD